jgi:hypothetical protein
MSSGASVRPRIPLARLPWDETHGAGKRSVTEPNGGSEEPVYGFSDPGEDPLRAGRIESPR